MGKKSASSSKTEPLDIECTINLGKVLAKIAEKKRAPRATREIRKFAAKQLGTSDVRIDVGLNKHVWSRGIRHVPKRVRVRMSRRVNDDEDATEVRGFFLFFFFFFFFLFFFFFFVLVWFFFHKMLKHGNAVE
jgi:large subunit ribosomal protein L31e